MVVLGLEPAALTVVVQAGSAFESTATNTAGAWAADDTISLRFSDGTEWFAAITGAVASWDEPAVTVDALIATGARRVGLWYVNTSSIARPVRWASGTLTVAP